jgi:hypothetical protein
MRQLNAHDVVRICEWGRDKHPLDRALVLLRAASPGVEPMVLAQLPIGRRDALLLELRARSFGPKLEVLVPCPKCGERLEMTLTTDELRVPVPESPRSLLELEGWAIDYRLPDSNDLAALAHLKDPRTARARLPALASRLAEDDPQADITFRLDCPGCGHNWRAAFDILSFFWTELETQARQLQREVHELARVYGWNESTILSMSAVSRHRYLELVTSG